MGGVVGVGGTLTGRAAPAAACKEFSRILNGGAV